jgi:hypothetical protein
VLEGHVREAMTAALPDGRDGTAALGDGVALMRLLEGRAAVVLRSRPRRQSRHAHARRDDRSHVPEPARPRRRRV